MKKILFLVLGLIVAGSILVFLAKGFIVKIGMEQAVTRLTGFKTQIRTLKYDLPSTIRIQDNNLDTILALAQRTFGGAYQFVPPMSVTLGMRECLSARRVRVYSDTGAWKQTALRVALFSEPTPEYPMTLLQRHPDALLTATMETTRHPVSENPEWELF